jgi:hypothetical protein
LGLLFARRRPPHNGFDAAGGRAGVGAAGRRTDLAAAAALGLACAATRWTLRGHDLFSWDSGLLASGILSYDFASGYPHPPYYPLTIGLGKVLAPWAGPVGALVALSVLASGVLAAFTFLVARGWLPRWASAVAAGLVVLSPTALFNGVAPLSYALEGAGSAVVAWTAWRCRAAGTWRWGAALGVATSAAIGIRPSALFLVAPLALWAVWPRRATWVGAVGGGAVASLAWAVPALMAGGGLGWFLKGTRMQSRQIVFAHTVFQDGWGAVADNVHRLASYVPVELPFLIVLLVLALASLPAWWRHRPPAPATAFLAAWLLPPLAFFVLVYAGWPVYPSGYVLALVPAVAVATAAALAAMARALAAEGPAPAKAVALLALVVAAPMPAAWAASWPAAVSGQREADAYAASWWALERDYPANETALLTYYGWFWCRLDHPDYLSWGTLPSMDDAGRVWVQVAEARHLRDDRPALADALDGHDDPQHAIPPWVKHVVVVYGPPSRQVTDVLKPGVPREDRVLESGLRVTVVDPAPYGTVEQMVKWFDDAGRAVPS